MIGASAIHLHLVNQGIPNLSWPDFPWLIGSIVLVAGVYIGAQAFAKLAEITPIKMRDKNAKKKD